MLQCNVDIFDLIAFYHVECPQIPVFLPFKVIAIKVSLHYSALQCTDSTGIMLNCQVLFCFDQDPTELNTFVNALKCERCGYPGVLPVQPLDLDSEWRVGMGTWSLLITLSHLSDQWVYYHQPRCPSLKCSVKSVTVQQTRQKLRIFFQETDQ